ncbi:hypothetical protein B0I35DRAFT_405203 [Stachybotrys elegans]|uniref:Uncharacterized protein n=1 Tax=Stachybotrys elegans TaxID=80388 RepID=A0A8K0SVC1_9HYPO|nr:hypothetical protein B0I35DRAFT_405203 [Stachybotrys elegans]
MSRVTAPVTKLARTLNTASPHNAGAVIMPKYAELLRNRRSAEHTDSSRGLTTTHRPTPQPSIANRSKPLMQTFHSDALASHASPPGHLDAAVLPMGFSPEVRAEFAPRVPLLPDNYAATYMPFAEPPAPPKPEVTVVAVDPSKVLPATAFSGLEGVDLKFVYDHSAEEDSHASMLKLA